MTVSSTLGRTCPVSQTASAVAPLFEPLEPRLLLSGTAGQLAVELFSVSPALFVENAGQWADPAVRYVHSGAGANVAMTEAGVLFEVVRRDPIDGTGDESGSDDPLAWPDRLDPDAYQTHALQFSASFVGAYSVAPVGLNQAETVFNYFIGDDQSLWREGVASYEIVAWQGLYEGIDLRTWGLRSSLKYEFIVAPGADWSVIQVRYDGIAGLAVADDGSLQVDLGTDWGVLTDDAPYIYQVIGGEQVEVAGRFVLLDEWTYSFELTGPYDPTLPLVLDPDLAWSTYLGGSGSDYGYGTAVDTSGNVLVTGYTNSPNFSGTNDAHKGGQDAFVTKVSSDGSLLWATYLGGSSHDYAWGIAIDASGNALVVGETQSTNFSGGQQHLQWWQQGRFRRQGVLGRLAVVGDLPRREQR